MTFEQWLVIESIKWSFFWIFCEKNIQFSSSNLVKSLIYLNSRFLNPFDTKSNAIITYFRIFHADSIQNIQFSASFIWPSIHVHAYTVKPLHQFNFGYGHYCVCACISIGIVHTKNILFTNNIFYRFGFGVVFFSLFLLIFI